MVFFRWLKEKLENLGPDEAIILVDYKNPFDMGRGKETPGNYFSKIFSKEHQQKLKGGRKQLSVLILKKKIIFEKI